MKSERDKNNNDMKNNRVFYKLHDVADKKNALADIVNMRIILAKDINSVAVLEIQHLSEAEAFYSLRAAFIFLLPHVIRETQAINPNREPANRNTAIM